MKGADYNHNILKQAVISSRTLNVTIFCRELNITRQHFYDVINGQRYVSEETLKRIAQKLGVSSETLFTLEDAKNLPNSS